LQAVGPFGPIDDAHAAFANELHQPKATKFPTDQIFRRSWLWIEQHQGVRAILRRNLHERIDLGVKYRIACTSRANELCAFLARQTERLLEQQKGLSAIECAAH
jgi:hypothetical protein